MYHFSVIQLLLNTMDDSFVTQCLNDTIEGLREGLSDFSGQSTTAVIYRLNHNEDLFIYDPDSLLRGHELKIKKFYYSEENGATTHEYLGNSNCYSQIEPVADFQIDGLLSFGGSSATVPYQMWFTEHHPDVTSTGPTHSWLEHTVLRFSHDIANDSELYTGISGKFLREYSTHAIHNYIVKESQLYTGRESQFQIYAILNAVLTISKTREEGEWPTGELVFIEPDFINTVEFYARFVQGELPRLNNFKHVRKLLQTVEDSAHKLISDGLTILGISNSILPAYSLTAEFHGRYGYMKINNDTICSFADGRFKSSSLKAKLYEVEEALLDHKIDTEIRDNLFHIISTLVHDAQSMKHGCTFVIDLNDKPTLISGQLLQKPLDLQKEELLKLACAFSKVDGALHICKDLHLHGFACLLDGHAISGEDRARGARYNSALRFTAENPMTIVVVVSVDRPVSVIQNGIVQHGHCQWRSKTNCSLKPEPLQQWLELA